MSDNNKKRPPSLLQGGPYGNFEHNSGVIRNAMNSRGGFSQQQQQGGGRKTPKSTKRYNIRIDRRAGGFNARVSVGSLFGKHKDYVANTLSEIFPQLEESAKRAFAAGSTDVSPEDMPGQFVATPATYHVESRREPELSTEPQPNTRVDMTNCPKCGAPVEYGKFCGNDGTQAPEKPTPQPEPSADDLTSCAKCSSPVPWSKFCLECGTKAADKPTPTATAKGKFCGDCGAQVPEGKKFCISCGSKL